MNIPKIIHQIWLGPRTRPQFWMDTWKIDYLNNYPDWEYRLWTEKEVKELTLVNKKFYNRLAKNNKRYDKFAGMADILRYEILYQFGGVFIDADSIWMNNKNLDDLLTICHKQMKTKVLNRILKNKKVDPNILNQIMEVQDDKITFNLQTLRSHLDPDLNIDLDINQCLFCAWEPDRNHVANGVMGANPGNTALKEIIYNKLPLRCQKIGMEKPYLSVGPFLLDLVRKDMVVLPDYYFYPVYWQNNKNKIIWLSKKERDNVRKDCYMYQFGYTTNQLGEKVKQRMNLLKETKKKNNSNNSNNNNNNNNPKNNSNNNLKNNNPKIKKKPKKNIKKQFIYNPPKKG